MTFRLKESYSSARSTIERMKTNSKSSTKLDTTSNSSSPPFDQRQPISPKLSHQPSKSIMLLFFMQYILKQEQAIEWKFQNQHLFNWNLK